jgi:hypothetical protein
MPAGPPTPTRVSHSVIQIDVPVFFRLVLYDIPYLNGFAFLLISNTVRVIKSRSTEGAEHAARMLQMRNAYIIMFWKPEGEKLLGRPRSRWEDVRMYIKEIVSVVVKLMQVSQVRDQ